VSEPDDAAERQAAALERLADEVAYQNAVLTEVAFALHQHRAEQAVIGGLRGETKTPSLRSLLGSIEDHRFTREEDGGDYA